MTSALNRITSAVSRTNRALETTDRLTDQVNPGDTFSRSTTAIGNATQQVEQFNRRQNEAGNGANNIKNAWGGVGRLIKTAVAAFSIKQIIGLADSMTQTTARLDLMNDGLQTTAELQDMIMKSANRSRASYQATADAVSKMGIMAKDAFSSNEELIAFSELINKQFTIAGTSAAGVDAAMLQLTQAMSSGVLRGEELNSVFEQAPTIIQTIADYLGVPIGKIREMAAEGQITSTIVKNAMLSSADEINAKFQAMPMTFSQVGTILGNMLLQTFQPVIQVIGQGAQWIYDNWSTIEPIFWGLVAAVGAYAIMTGIWTAVTWLQVAANRALLASMLTNPILWIAIAIGVIIALIYKWIQSVGGLRVAWLIVCNALLTAWDWVQIGFMTGVYWVMDMWNKLQLAFMTAGVNITNFMGDMKANVLMILQNMVNGAIKIINGFISMLNKIPGVSIDLIQDVTFGTTAQLENEAAKQTRNQGLEAYRSQIESQIADRDAKLNQMKTAANVATAQRQAEIATAKADAANKKAAENVATAQRQAEIATAKADAANKKAAENEDIMSKFSGSTDIPNVGSVDEVGKIKDDVNIADEDLKFFRDVAEMRYVQNFVTLTPTVAVDAKISEKVDVDEVIGRIESKLEDEFVAAAEGVYS
jgi:tape measure domain-containing protein